MSITRRSLMQGLLATAGAVYTGTGHTRAAPPRTLLVYDSRLPTSRALIERHNGPTVDLAHERSHRWRCLRSLRSRGPVVGLTSWSDLVQVRAVLEPRGLRIRAEARRGRLFYWVMA